MPLNSGLFSSKAREWETPQGFFDRLNAEFGFTLDAAASSKNAKCERYYTVQDDALQQAWTGTVWCNPPYGRVIGRFIRKGFEAAQKGATVVMLIPSRTDTKYWHNYVMRAKEIRFVRGRLQFIGANGRSGKAPFPSAVVIFEGGDHKPLISTMGA